MEEVEFDRQGRPPGAAPVRIDDAARIAQYGAEHPDTFAGCWLEPDGSQVVAFTANIEEHRTALSTRIYAPERITYVTYRYSYQHLLDLRDRIPSVVGADVLAMWGPDTKANKVRVVVLPDHFDDVRQMLLRTNPDDVYVEAGHRPIPM